MQIAHWKDFRTCQHLGRQLLDPDDNMKQARQQQRRRVYVRRALWMVNFTPPLSASGTLSREVHASRRPTNNVRNCANVAHAVAPQAAR